MPTEKPEDNSVRADLEAAFVAATKAQEPDDTADVSNQPAPIEPKADKPEAVKAADAKPSAKDAAKDASKDAAKSKPQGLEPPARWTKEEKEEWASMLDEGMDEKTATAIVKAQRILVNRNKSVEGWFTKQMQDLNGERAQRADLDKLLEPRRAVWRAAGLQDHVALEQIMSGFDFADRDPAGFVRWFAGIKGIDLAAYGGRQQQQQAPQGDDDLPELHPAVKQALAARDQELARLRQELQHVGQSHQQADQRMQSWQQQQDAAIQQDAARELQAFESATDDNGAPKYPFYQDVRTEMGRMISAGIAKDLADAYDRATFANPGVRQKVLESRELAARKSWEKQLSDSAKRAKGAAGSISAASPAVSTDRDAPQPPPDSVRGALEQALTAQMQRSSGRV